MSEVSQQPEEAKVKGVADIVFCFDCTGSMARCIDEIKKNVDTFISGIDGTSGQTTTDWRVRVVGYRDFNVDSEKIINNMPFVTSVEEFRSQLSLLKADGGGDEPESALDAMWYIVKETDWRNRCHRIVVMFTDATSLPVHKDTVDKFSVMGDQDFLVQEMANERIKLFLFCKDCETFEDMQTLPKSYIKLYADPVKEFMTADFNDILETIAKTVSKTVTEPVL